MTSESPNKHTLQIYEEVNQMKLKLIQMRTQKEDLARAIQKQEAENKVQNIQIESLEAKIIKQGQDYHKLIEELDKVQSEKVKLIEREQIFSNKISSESAHIHKLENLNKSFQEENQRLKKEIETFTTEKIGLLREKQNSINKLIIIQSKFQALTMEHKFVVESGAETKKEYERLREENKNLLLRVVEKENPLQVQAVVRDEKSNTQKLVKEFQDKIQEKDESHSKQRKAYEERISVLANRIKDLERFKHSQS